MKTAITLTLLACLSCAGAVPVELEYDCSKRSFSEKILPVCVPGDGRMCRYGCPGDTPVEPVANEPAEGMVTAGGAGVVNDTDTPLAVYDDTLMFVVDYEPGWILVMPWSTEGGYHGGLGELADWADEGKKVKVCVFVDGVMGRCEEVGR